MGDLGTSITTENNSGKQISKGDKFLGKTFLEQKSREKICFQRENSIFPSEIFLYL